VARFFLRRHHVKHMRHVVCALTIWLASASFAARHTFARQTGYPHGRPGYVIDHVVPLACGGADAPANMQWQTIAAGKAKDRTERVGCK
jgi:hypothetical protein